MVFKKRNCGEEAEAEDGCYHCGNIDPTHFHHQAEGNDVTAPDPGDSSRDRSGNQPNNPPTPTRPDTNSTINDRHQRRGRRINWPWARNEHIWRVTTDRIKRVCSWESCEDGGAVERNQLLYECVRCGRHVCFRCIDRTGRRRCGRE